MKRITFYNILFIFLLCSFETKAAETATQILNRCAETVNEAELLDVNFTLNAGGQTADFTMKISHEKFMMESTDVAVWYNGVTQWTYVKSSRELNITDPTTDELMESNPFSILNFYSKVYNTQRLAGTGIAIEMTSKDSNATIRKAVVSINSKTYLPSKIVVTLHNGRTMTAVITSITKGKRPSATTFTYDKAMYPATETIDLR